MDWLVYWFMFPACILIAAVATFSGISGAAFITPVFLVGFPLMGVPPLSTVAAIGTSLFLETSGFGTAVYRYWRRRLADMRAVSTLAAVTVPLGVLGSVTAHHAPTNLLRIGYGAAMIAVAILLYFTRVKAADAVRSGTSARVLSVSRSARMETVPRNEGGKSKLPMVKSSSTALKA